MDSNNSNNNTTGNGNDQNNNNNLLLAYLLAFLNIYEEQRVHWAYADMLMRIWSVWEFALWQYVSNEEFMGLLGFSRLRFRRMYLLVNNGCLFWRIFRDAQFGLMQIAKVICLALGQNYGVVAANPSPPPPSPPTSPPQPPHRRSPSASPPAPPPPPPSSPRGQ